MSIVRENLMTRVGYRAYCGNEASKCSMPRMFLYGKEFHCISCKYSSDMGDEFLDQYHKHWLGKGEKTFGELYGHPHVPYPANYRLFNEVDSEYHSSGFLAYRITHSYNYMPNVKVYFDDEYMHLDIGHQHRETYAKARIHFFINDQARVTERAQLNHNRRVKIPKGTVLIRYRDSAGNIVYFRPSTSNERERYLHSNKYRGCTISTFYPIMSNHHDNEHPFFDEKPNAKIQLFKCK